MSHQGFLTHTAKTSMPYEPIDIRLLLAIEDGIRAAWARIIGDTGKHAKILSSGYKEVEITVDLELELDLILEEKICPAFTDLHFVAPKRGVECVNFDGTKLEKRPDLTFYLKARRPGCMSNYDAVFAECKILDATSGKKMAQYTKDGLIRFLNGNYAWAMPGALMIGYVLTPQKLSESLVDYFKKKDKVGVLNSDKYNLIGIPETCEESGGHTSNLVCCTEHERNWTYPGGKCKPGNITIRHLWLEA